MAVKTKYLFFTLTLLSLIASSHAFTKDYGKIYGTFYDTLTKEPLVGASIVLNSTKLGCFTNLDGKYFVDSIPTGKYSIRARMLGYKTDTLKNIYIKADSIYTIDFYLKTLCPPLKNTPKDNICHLFDETKYGVLKGRVFDSETKEPLPAVTVHIINCNIIGETNLDGFYTIKKLRVNTYTIWASYGSYNNSIKKTTTVRPDSITTVNFYLKPTSPKADKIIRTGPMVD